MQEQPHRSRFNISEWCMDHPYWIVAFYMTVFALFVLTVMFYMPRRMMPYVESPMIGIVSMMPGLSAEEMETYISKPIEERMTAIKGVRFIRSSSQEGFSMISLEFPYGTDMKRALVDVQALMNVVQADLPVTGANLKPSWVVPIDPLNLPVLTLSLTGDNRWNPVTLRELADNEVINRLKTVPNVYSVSTYGGRKRQLQVVVDRNRLSAYGLSILDIKKSLDRNNVARPGGILTSGSEEAIVRVNNLALSSDAVLDYPVKSEPDGRVVYVKDVGRVVDTFQERRSAFHFVDRGKIEETVAINVVQDPGASSPTVIDGVKGLVKQLEAEHPGTHFEIAYDNAHFVGILFENMFTELGLAVLLTALSIFLFLDNWRATVIAIITIPISLMMSILLLVPLGMSLNSSTLIGVVLSIGRDTDDTVVDIHAIQQHLRLGKDPRRAAIDGVTEVRLAVLASTLMTILALTPLLLTGGIVEQMFVGLVWPIILGNTTSFFVELTLTPLIAAKFLRLPPPMSARPLIYRAVIDPLQSRISWLENRYGDIVAWALRNRFAVISLGLASIIIGFGFYNFIGTEMMPLGDVGQAYGVVETRAGTSFARTEQIVTEIEKLLAKEPEVEKVAVELGIEGGPSYASTRAVYFTGYSMNQPNTATMMITLSDKGDRKRSIWQVIDSVQEKAMKMFPNELRRVQIKEMGSDVMASSQAPISLLIYGKDLTLLDKLGQKVAEISKTIPGLVQVSTDWTMGLPSKEVKIDLRKALEFGLAPEEVAEQLYYALGGGFTNEYYRLPNIRQDTILVRYEFDQRRNNEQDINQVYLTNDKGQSVPLSSIATVEDRKAPTVVTHDGMRRVITVLGFYRLGGLPSMDLSMEAMQKAISQINWPPGYGVEMRGDMTQMSDSLRRLSWGMLFCLILLYMMLVAQFKGWIQPLQMMLSLPFELSGVFFGLLLMSQSFSTVSIMSVILLTGMHITTAVLMIDAIDELRKQGVPKDEAIRKGCLTRIRPILMTNIATILVMIPVSVFPETGMDAWAPMGTVVLWGLVAGTVLALLIIPVMHSLVDDFSDWLRRKTEKQTPPEGS
jgi:HAE1 family hydrophobic/amphiphilic exporter-1